MGHTVVFDVNVLVGAVVAGRSDFESWPSPPPTSDNPFADCVGIANDAREFSLWLSEHILQNVVNVLTDPNDGFGWEIETAEEYSTFSGTSPRLPAEEWLSRASE